MAKITDLADELLLQITFHIRGRLRNTYLANPSLVSRRFRPIAQEALLKEPCFKLGAIDSFMLELSRQDWVIPKIRSLELWSTHEDRYDQNGDSLPGTSPLYKGPRNIRWLPRAAEYTKIPCPPELSARMDLDSSLATIKRFSKRPEHVDLWLSAMTEDVVQGLLGILLVSLPNLKELRCAAVWLMDFPLLSNILSAEVIRIWDSNWMHPYLAGVMSTLAQKLEVLEIPTNCWILNFYGNISSLFDLTSFDKLKELTVSMKILNYLHFNELRLDPRAVGKLPPNLQVLRISDGEVSTKLLVRDICEAKNTGRLFQSLERVEILYGEAYHRFLQVSRQGGWLRLGTWPNPIQDLREYCSKARLSIALCFPGVSLKAVYTDRSLWSLVDNRELLPAELKVFCRGDFSQVSKLDSHAFDQLLEIIIASRTEFAFDADGDSDMLDC